MKRVLIFLAMTLGLATFADAQVSFGIGIRESGLSIGINMSSYPRLVPVPGYPVYYDPRGNSNYFFYDGLYWVFENDNWYSSSWYDGPWDLIDPYYVPLFVLRVPVRYYHRPPAYFRGWRADAAPRWDQHWGGDWNAHRRGWDRWDRRSVPRPAPLPSYQSQFSGGRYPRAPEQQHSIRSDKYRYEPRDSQTRQFWQRGSGAAAPSRAEPRQRPEAPRQQEQQNTQFDRTRQQEQQRQHQEQQKAQAPPAQQRQRTEPQGKGQEVAPAATREKNRKKTDEAKDEGRGNRSEDRDHDRGQGQGPR